MSGILAGPNPLSKLIMGNVLGVEISNPSWRSMGCCLWPCSWSVLFLLESKCAFKVRQKQEQHLHSQGSYLLSKVHRQNDLNLKAHGATRHPCHDTWYLLSAFVGFYTVSTQWSCKKKRTELQIRHSNREWSPNPGLMERHHLYRALRMQFGKERELSQMSHFKL